MVYGPRGGGRSMGPPWTSQWPAAGELTGARARDRSGARRLAAEAREARGRRGDPSGGLTLGGGTARRPSDGGERSLAAALGVRGARGEEVKGGERG